MFAREDNTERFYASGAAADDDVVRAGFRWLSEYAAQHGHRHAALVVPGLRNVDNLARIIGAGPAKQLSKNRQLRFGDLMLQLFTESKVPYSFGGPILAVWTRDKSLEKLDTTGAPAICAAPWVQDNIEAWKANWNPTDVVTGQQGGSSETVGNPVVAKALEWLTATVNVGTGLSNPSDRSSAIHMFRMLRDGGENYDPDEVRAWAVRHGWRPEDARELGEIAEKILAGRALRAGSEGAWRDDALDRLREEAAGGG